MSVDEGTRSRVLRAVVACAGRVGLSRITVEEVARESGVSRASVYRHFPGGRDQLVDEAITWEVGQFLTRLAAAVEDAPDFATRLEWGLSFAHRAIEEHEVLQKVLETEPGGLLPHLRDTTPLVLAVIRDYLRPYLDCERLRPGVDADEAAEYLARMIMSFMATQGSWRLDDPAEVRDLVRSEFLAGVLEVTPDSD
jgi:AcrR family transcriptional regulator